MKRIIFIMAVAVCLCSYEKEQSHWLNERWCGEYETTMINNDTGEIKDYIAAIVLEFSDDRSECIVTKGVEGLYASSRKTYSSYLNETEKIFVMNEGDYDSRILYWGKLTGKNTAQLNWYSGEKLISIEVKIINKPVRHFRD
jgi:hypothetical protein